MLFRSQVGDSFDSTGLVLLATTDQGEKMIRDGFLCSPSRFTREGTQNVIISYGGQSCSIELTVSPAAPKETPAPETEQPAATAAPERPHTTERPAGRSENTRDPYWILIALALLFGLGAALIFVYLAKTEQLNQLWQRLTRRRDDDEDENDDFTDDENDD